jgi:prepilin-type N-terminal cleavage/methylation domain-containing protein
MTQRCRCAFTLVELLVVITIIVILLALLAPALDQAIYQAELTVCAANQRGVASGAVTYAMDYRRSYPHRPGVFPEGGWTRSWRDTSIVALPPFGPEPDGYDDRPVLRGYMSINKHLVCPLTRPLDLANSVANTEACYQLWFGFRFRGQNNVELPGMLKMGDRLVWQTTNFASPGGMEVLKFNLLASDLMDVAGPNDVMAAHPDRDGNMVLRWFQDTDFNTAFGLGDNQSADTTGTGGPGAAAGGARFTFTRWHYNGNLTPRAIGSVDRNFAHQDLSVSRITDITLQEMTDEEHGERRGLARIPIFSGGNGWPVQYTNLPRE